MRMLVILVGLFIHLTSIGLSQGRLSLAPTVGYNVGNYAVKVKSNYIHDNQAHHKGHTFGSSLGLTAHYHFTEKWDLSLGVIRTQLTAREKVNSLLDPSLLTSTWLQEYSFYQIPILLNYRSSPKRLATYISLGTVLSNQSLNDNPAWIKPSALLGIGINYQLNHSLSLLLQPTASYLFSKPRDNMVRQFESYQSYLLALQAQLSWRF